MVRFIHCRTLNSQSAASISVNNLSAILEEKHYETKINLLSKKLTLDSMRLINECEKYQIIVAKINYQDYEYIFHLLEMLKKSGYVEHIIIMGVFASLNYESIIKKYQFIDGIILGSGENNIIKIVESLLKYDKIIPSITGGVWNSTNGIIVNEASTNIPMKHLPLPSRQIEILETEQLGNLEFSRGCTMGCKYCHLTCMKKYQSYSRDTKSVDQVIEDIKALSACGKRYIIFNDSMFWDNENDTPRIKELCERIINLNIDIHFMVYLSLSKFPPTELIILMRKAGLIRIFIGVESNEETELQEIKTQYKKQVSFEEFAKICKDIGITYHIGYMVFYPFSDYDTVKNSLEYLIKINKVHRVGIILAKMRLIPGSKMFKKYYVPCDDTIDKALQYKFCDMRVEKIYNALNYVFGTLLNNYHANNEILCCSIDLLEEICNRQTKLESIDLSKSFQQFRIVIGNYQDILKEFLYMVIEHYTDSETEYNTEDIAEYSSEFIEKFLTIREELQFYWAKLICEINSAYHIEIEKQIFTER